MVVTDTGLLYSFGWNFYGQLGLGHQANRNTPSQVAIEAVRSVCAGYNHTVAITREGRLFTWGSNGHGLLGHGDTAYRFTPTVVASIANLKAKQVTAGVECTLVLDAEGSIWIAGRLREHHGGPSSKTFHRVQVSDIQGDQPSRFEQVSCSCYHALAVTTDGALFSWGGGDNGQLGNGFTEDDGVPRLVRTLEGVPIASAAAGDATSLALARSGEMWSWGKDCCMYTNIYIYI